ncbi:MAG: NAD(P)H-binding protein [Nocardioidaceae bacterium]|nr:NAD(P)H-binding protein [Nocardioidaceae bacterium]
MRVLLTGGTGCVGGGVAEALVSGGHQVAALVRTPEGVQAMRALGAEAHLGDLADRHRLLRLIRECDAFVHTAFVVGDHDGGAEIDLIRTAIAALSGTGKPFVYTSGLWVLGPSGAEPLTESAPYRPTPLVAFRTRAEDLVLEAVNFGIRSTIVRPGVVYGGACGLIQLLRDGRDEDGTVVYVGDGGTCWPMVHRDDLGVLYERALRDAPSGSIWHAVDEPGVPVREIALALADALGVPGRVRQRDLDDARAELGALADALAENQVVSGAKARDELGWEPRSPGVLDWLRDGHGGSRTA